MEILLFQMEDIRKIDSDLGEIESVVDELSPITNVEGGWISC